ncbi:MAG TPA: SDR family oxidoreductase [Jatrophihabitans sp.]|jgi:hypothetical protein
MSTALVTGPTAGIGLAFARRLAKDGYDLVLVARNEARLSQVAAELAQAYGTTSEVLVADLGDRDQLAAVEKRVAEGVDVLVNNAGYGLNQPFWANDVAEEQQLLDVLVTAPMRLSHAAVREMRVRRGGTVINVASVAAFTPRGTYSAAKAYLVNLSEWLNQFCASDGVRVMALCPGFVRTEFHQRGAMDMSHLPFFAWLDATRVVEDAMTDLERGRAVSVPSLRYKTVVAASRLVPRRVVGKIASIGRAGPN